MLVYDDLVWNKIQLLLKKNLILVDVPHNDVVSFFTDTGYNSAIEVTQNHKTLFQEVGIYCAEHIYPTAKFLIFQYVLSFIDVADNEIIACLRQLGFVFKLIVIYLLS